MVQVISQKILISLLTLFFYSFVFAQESSQITPNGSTSSTTIVNPDEPPIDPSETIQDSQTESMEDSPASGTIIEPNGYDVVSPGSEFPEPNPESSEEDDRSPREDQIDPLPEDGSTYDEGGLNWSSPSSTECPPGDPACTQNLLPTCQPGDIECLQDDYPICAPYDTECILNQNSDRP